MKWTKRNNEERLSEQCGTMNRKFNVDKETVPCRLFLSPSLFVLHGLLPAMVKLFDQLEYWEESSIFLCVELHDVAVHGGAALDLRPPLFDYLPIKQEMASQTLRRESCWRHWNGAPTLEETFLSESKGCEAPNLFRVPRNIPCSSMWV